MNGFDSHELFGTKTFARFSFLLLLVAIATLRVSYLNYLALHASGDGVSIDAGLWAFVVVTSGWLINVGLCMILVSESHRRDFCKEALIINLIAQNAISALLILVGLVATTWNHWMSESLGVAGMYMILFGWVINFFILLPIIVFMGKERRGLT